MDIWCCQHSKFVWSSFNIHEFQLMAGEFTLCNNSTKITWSLRFTFFSLERIWFYSHNQLYSPAVKGKTQNSLINFFSLLIITLRVVYNEMQVGVKILTLEHFEKFKMAARKPKNWRKFLFCYIFVTILAINPNKISVTMFLEIGTVI